MGVKASGVERCPPGDQNHWMLPLTLSRPDTSPRLQIVELLRERPFAVGDIAEVLAIRQPQVSKHLGVLREVGLVAAETLGRRRIYHLRAEPFEETGSWVDSFERLSEVRLDPLDTFLHSMGETRAGEHRPEG